MNQLFGQPTNAARAADSDLGSVSVPARPLPVGGAEQAFFHLDIKRSLQLHWRLARNVAIGGVAMAVLYLLAQVYVFHSWPAYEAESTVYVQPTPPKVFEPAQGGSPRWPYDTNTYESYIQQQMMNVTRDDVLASALKKIGDFQEKGESEQQAAQRLVQSLSVTREGSAYDFSIGARAGTAQFAADIANDVTAAYMESTARDQHTGDEQRLSMLGDEKDRIAKALDADRAEQESLNRQLGVASVGSAVPDHYDEDITSTRTELIKARTEHDAAEAKFAAFDAGHGPSSAAIDAAADEIVASDAGLVSMKQVLNARRAALISQMANLTPSHPQYKQDEVELTKINGELDGMMKDLRAKAASRIQLQLQAELQRTAGVESQVNGQLRQLVGSAGSATPKMQRSSDLASDITRLQARYATVDEQLHNLLLEDNAPASAYQVTPAVPPLYRTKTGVLRNVILIIFAGIAFGILAAVAAHKRDPKVYIAKDVELILGFPPMALLPDFNEVSGGVAEEYLLRLASSIEHARKQSQLRSCVFTGTGAGNGVTVLVNRVGEMLQAMGRTTVLVDASGAPTSQPRPRPAHSEGTVGNIPGLVPVERVSRPTALLQQMAEESETQDESLVLTDTAPLPVSAETEYLARFVDCAIVVIQSGKTTRRELRVAAATLQRLDVAAVGFILNRVGLKKADPAFRESVQAIEKHLEMQATQNVYRPESIRSSVVDEPWSSDKQSEAETMPQEGSPRALFEAELAAASAAVERFSHPAGSDAVASVPSPNAPEASYVPEVPHAAEAEAEAAGRYSSPLAYEDSFSFEHPVHSAMVNDFVHQPLEPLAEEVVVQETSAPLAEQAFESSPASMTAPFLDAAQRVSSNFSAEPSLVHWAVADSAPFVYKADHLVPAVSDDKASASHSAEQLELVAEDDQVGDLSEQGGDLSENATEAPAFVEAYLPPAHHVESSFEDPADVGPVYDLHPAALEFKHNLEPVVAQPATADVSPAISSVAEAPEPIAAASAESAPEPVASEPVPSETVPAEQAEPAPALATPALPMPALAAPVSHEPWWLSEVTPHRVPNRPPVLWKPAKVSMSNRAAGVPDSSPEELDLAADQGTEKLQPWAAPAHSWKPIVNISSLHIAGPGVEEEQATEQDQLGTNLSSRLSGLRSLLYVLGVKSPEEASEPAERLGNNGSNFDMRTERQAYDSIYDSASKQDREAIPPASIGGASPRLVTAPPEFLPPKTVSISTGRDDAAGGEALGRLDRRASYDGVDILPSRKGQYKKV